MTEIPTGWLFGPWAPNLDRAEHRARCRSMRAIARLVAGPRAGDLVEILRVAEALPWLVAEAVPVLESMGSLDRRRILATYGSLA